MSIVAERCSSIQFSGGELTDPRGGLSPQNLTALNPALDVCLRNRFLSHRVAGNAQRVVNQRKGSGYA